MIDMPNTIGNAWLLRQPCGGIRCSARRRNKQSLPRSGQLINAGDVLSESSTQLRIRRPEGHAVALSARQRAAPVPPTERALQSRNRTGTFRSSPTMMPSGAAEGFIGKNFAEGDEVACGRMPADERSRGYQMSVVTKY